MERKEGQSSRATLTPGKMDKGGRNDPPTTLRPSSPKAQKSGTILEFRGRCQAKIVRNDKSVGQCSHYETADGYCLKHHPERVKYRRSRRKQTALARCRATMKRHAFGFIQYVATYAEIVDLKAELEKRLNQTS